MNTHAAHRVFTLTVPAGILAGALAGALLGAPAWGAQRAGNQNSRPDTPGTGPYPAMKEEIPALPRHVVYRPANVPAMGAQKLGVVAWGNGGCSDDAASTRFHLLELASHGYLVIASGRILSGRAHLHRYRRNALSRALTYRISPGPSTGHSPSTRARAVRISGASIRRRSPCRDSAAAACRRRWLPTTRA